MRELIKKPATKLNIFYIALVVILYGGFWFGFYLLNIEWAIGLGVAVVVIPLILFAIFNKSTSAAVVLGLLTGVGLGLCISAYFLHANLNPSKFFGLVLLILIGIKCLQAYICSVIKYKRTYLAIFAVVEVAAAIVVLVYASIDPALMSQIAFSIGIGVFLSLGQIGYFSKKRSFDSWRNAAVGLFIGYIILFLLIISLISGEGDGVDLSGFGGEVGNGSKKKKKKDVNKTLELNINKDLKED